VNPRVAPGVLFRREGKELMLRGSTGLRRLWSSIDWDRWRAAALLGLVSSTFSTLVSHFAGPRIGRDSVVDWMVVAAIPLREGVLQVEPSWPVILAGILFHQWADFSWALVFFGLLGRWTGKLGPWAILLVAPFWALFTSALEWFVLVPLVPFWQPIFTLGQPYWIGLVVHLTSASMYPLFPWLRDWVAGRRSRHARFAAAWSSLAAVGVLACGLLAFLGWQGREAAHRGTNEAYDQSYMRRMMAHHAQGVELAGIGVERASDPHLRSLARLMAASLTGENRIFAQWWTSWFQQVSDICSPQEMASMPGMLSPDEMGSARRAEGPAFDALFVRLMTVHHAGAIRMAGEAIGQAGDIRLKLMAHGIRHSQRGEIELMHGTHGIAAVKSAALALVAPAGQHPAEGRGARPF
jgi:uncharacterized protein (DUF305 family)